jgi:hypothetical protein
MPAATATQSAQRWKTPRSRGVSSVSTPALWHAPGPTGHP